MAQRNRTKDDRYLPDQPLIKIGASQVSMEHCNKEVSNCSHLSRNARTTVRTTIRSEAFEGVPHDRILKAAHNMSNRLR